MADKELKIRIKFDAKTGELVVAKNELNKLGTATNTAKTKVSSFNNTLSTTAKVMLSFAGVGLALKGVADSATALIQTASKFENFNAMLTTIEGSAKKAETSFNWIKDFAKTTPYQLDQVAESFIKLKNYGLKATEGSLKTLGDTAAALKKPLNDAVEAMADAVMGEFERLKEFGIKTKTMGDKIAFNWRDASGKSKVAIIENNSEIIESTLKSIWNSKYEGAMNDMMTTYSGMVSNMSDNWEQFKNDIAKRSGLFDGVKASLNLFNAEFSKMAKNEDVLVAIGSSSKTLFKILAKGTAIAITAFNGLGMILNIIKSGWEQIGASIGIGVNKLKLSFEKLHLAQLKVSGVVLDRSKDIRASKDEIKRLNREMNQYRDIIHGSNQTNLGFIRGLDEINKRAWKIADGFDETFGKKIPNVVENGTKKVRTKVKGAFNGSLNDVKKSTKKATKSIGIELKRREQLEKRTLNNINREYSSYLLSKEEKLNDWVKKKENEIKNNITDEKKKNEALYRLGLIAQRKYKKIEEDKTAKQKEEEEKRYQAFLENNTKTVAGFTAGFRDTAKSWENTTFNMVKQGQNFANSTASILSSNLFDVFDGKTKSMGDFFENTWDGMKKMFFKVIAEMAAKAIIMNFMTAWSGNATAGQGFVERFLGFDIPGLTFAKGTIWGDGRYGIVPGTPNYKGDDYRNDKIPALIAKGEAVIPRTAVSANREIVEGLIRGARVGRFAKGYMDTDILPAQMSMTDGVFRLKGGGISGIIGGIGGVLSDVYHAVKTPIQEVLGEAFKIVQPVLKPFVKNPELAWLAQAGLATAFPALIPTMLNANLVSTGLSVAQGSDLDDALFASGTSGMIAGAGASVSSLINTGAMPVSNQGVFAAMQSYPDTVMTSIRDKWATLKSGWERLTDVSMVNQEMGSNLTQGAWENTKENFLQIGQNIADMSVEGFTSSMKYLANPTNLFQHILDNMGTILKNIAISIPEMMANPFISSLAANGLTNSESPLNIKGGIVPFAKGGYITKPTLGLIGEAGAEIIAPEKKMREFFDSKNLESKIDKLISKIDKLIEYESYNLNINKKILVAVKI